MWIMVLFGLALHSPRQSSQLCGSVLFLFPLQGQPLGLGFFGLTFRLQAFPTVLRDLF